MNTDTAALFDFLDCQRTNDTMHHYPSTQATLRLAAFRSLPILWAHAKDPDMVWVATRPGVLMADEWRKFLAHRIAKHVIPALSPMIAVHVLPVIHSYGEGTATDTDLQNAGRGVSAGLLALLRGSSQPDDALLSALHILERVCCPSRFEPWTTWSSSGHLPLLREDLTGHGAWLRANTTPTFLHRS